MAVVRGKHAAGLSRRLSSIALMIFRVCGIEEGALLA